MQQEFNALQQEFQNNPQNPVFYRDDYGVPQAPLWNAPIPYDPTLQSTMDYYNNVFIKPNHRGQFPMGNHMLSLIFLANSDLSEQQRERLTSHLAYRNILMRNYTLDVVFAGFKTLFTSTKTGIADPLVRHGGLQRRHGRHRSFYLFEAGYWDEDDGYWAVDEEDDEQEGFLDINNDVFWTFNQDTDDWEQANVVGHRRVKAGKGKGKGKRRYKKKFRGKFKPYKRSGKAHFAETEYEADDSQWDSASQQSGWYDSYYGKGKSPSKGGKGKKSGKGYQPSGDKGQEKGSFKALRLREKGSMERARKARLTSVRKSRMEHLPPQRLLVHHGMTNLKKYIRNIGTAVDKPAGTPKMVKTGINGLCRAPAPSS